MKFFFYFISALLVMHGIPSYAQGEREDFLFETFINEVNQKNPSIHASEKRWKAEEAKIRATKTWPNPMVGADLWRIPSGKSPTPDNAGMDMYKIEQTIPFPGKLSANGDVQKHMALAALRDYKAVQLGILADATQAYYDLWYLKEAFRIHQDHAKLWERFSSVSERLYSSGKSNQMDILLAQVEVDKILNEVESIREMIPAAQARVNAFRNQGADVPIGNLLPPLVDNASFELNDLNNEALEKNPDIMAADHHVKHRRYNLKQSRLDYLPDFTVGYARMIEDNGFSGYNANLMLSIPLYFWKQGALKKSAEFNLEQKESEYEAARNQVGVDVRDVLAQLKNAGRTALLYKASILPRSRNALNVVESGYRGGANTFFDVLNIEKRLLLEELEYLAALKIYAAAKAQLNRTVGTDRPLRSQEE